MVSFKERTLAIVFLCLFVVSGHCQSHDITFKALILDSISKKSISAVSVKVQDGVIGTQSNEEGLCYLDIQTDKGARLVISHMGYVSKQLHIESKRDIDTIIFLQEEKYNLTEVIVRPKKEKYSKKNNPAVELIKKVISHKERNRIINHTDYRNKEYNRLLFALNDFATEQPLFKRYKFLSNYTDTSLIQTKKILPFSTRETLSENYYRKEPKEFRQVITGYTLEGIDQKLDTEALDAVVKEVFKDFSVFDNTITMMFRSFVGPLSEHQAVSFYKWYLVDTLLIDREKYIQVDFTPFNSRDMGFTGSLYISTDSSYAVKRAVMHTPKKMNINFVKELVIRHEFQRMDSYLWVPSEEQMAIDISMATSRFYVEKVRKYKDYIFEELPDSVFLSKKPIEYLDGYNNQSFEYWLQERQSFSQKDYRMDELVNDLMSIPFIKFTFNAGKIISSEYIPTRKDENKNKLDIGTLPTFYSYNSLEGNRLRLTLATTRNLNRHLYFYGYGAYGTRDDRFKYYAEATWAFNNVSVHKDEYPKNNLVLAYKYDINTLGQRYTQAERDNIFMSLNTSSGRRMTYNRQVQISFEKEYYGGFSFKLSGQTFNETPAGNLRFVKQTETEEAYTIDRIRTTEIGLSLRYAFKEKFLQQRRKRNSITSEKFIISLNHTLSLDHFLGGQYNYNRTSLSIVKEFWIAPFGRLITSAEAEKMWGTAPFPLLLTPSANNSYTIQRGSFYLLEPLEFIHDKQFSWELYYHMGGWLFNRIPLLKHLKWREVLGFRGFMGNLRSKNNPAYNREMLLFPQQSFTANKEPYMEYNIGIENIFNFFRIDYIHRINYLYHPGVQKNGFRFSFEINF